MTGGSLPQKSYMRRSGADIRFGRTLAIGQYWLDWYAETVWRVENIHRADCEAELIRGGETRTVTFAVMRTAWCPITPPGTASHTKREKPGTPATSTRRKTGQNEDPAVAATSRQEAA